MQHSVLSTFDALATLVDQSLLRQQEGPGGEPRFYMLETIREYALERLEGSGEAAALREAHARYYRALMIDAAPELRGPQTAVWLDRLEADHDNLRAALAWALAQGDAGVALRLAETVAWFWSLRGYLDEGRGWLARALALPGAAARTDLRARALNWAGVLAYRQSDARAARALFEEAAAIFREVNDAGGLGYSLALLGVVLLYGGDPAGARALLEESVRLFRATDDRWGLSLALRNFGEVARSQGDPAARRAALEESIALFRTIGDAWGLALASNTLGEAARLDGDYPRAAALFQDSLALFRELGDKQGTAWCLAELAAVAGGLGQPERAVRLFGATAALLDAIGARLDPVDRAAYDRNVAAVRAQLDPAAFAAAWDAGAALPFEAVLALATEIAPADPRPPAAPAARPAEPAPAPADPDALTPREIDVLRLVAAGLTDAEVAARLYLSPRTVQTHLRSIYSKLEITSRSAATRYAIEHHFV